jgi:hypothetical protein
MKPTKVTPLQNNRNHNNVCRWHEKHPQPWTWAQKRARRLEKGWNWKLLDAKWEKTKAQYTRCVPFALYKWKAFGFDGKQKPIWTIAGYVDMVENYEDPSDYVGMGWVGSDGRP